MRNFLTTMLTTAALMVPAGAFAQNESWADRVDEDDVQAVGYVVRVEDQQFDLRTHSEGVITFPIPQDADYSGVLQIGERVQVWYDQDLFNAGTASITYLESYSGPVAENDNADMSGDTEVENEIEEAANEAEAEIAEAGDEIEEAWDETTAEARELASETRTAAADAFDGEDDSDYESQTYDSDELPQTASNLPLILMAGGFLTLLGALALRAVR